MFLDLASFEEAYGCISGLCATFESQERVSVHDSRSRVLAADIISGIDVPGYPKSQMDGYALRSADTFSASEEAPVTLEIVDHVDAGKTSSIEIGYGQCAYVATGARVPQGADAVVMIEDVAADGTSIQIVSGTAPAQHVMKAGFDISKGARLFGKGQQVTPRMIGAMCAVGIGEVDVFCRPSVAVVSTGNEIRAPGDATDGASTYDINGPFLASACTGIGCDARYMGIAPDTEQGLRDILEKAAACDIVLMSAGVSKGVRDLSEALISKMGTIHLHGVNIKPGKPTLIATVGDALVIGLPGHPTSCATIFSTLVLPHIYRMCNRAYEPKYVTLPLSKRVYASRGRRQFLPVRIEDGTAVPVFRGSGAISSFLAADAIAILSESDEYLDRGDKVQVLLLGDNLV